MRDVLGFHVWLLAGTMWLGWCAPCHATAPPEARGFYLPTFSYGGSGTAAKLEQAVDDALAHNFNQLYVQVRSRGDAYHYPGRDDATYPNPEPRAARFSISPGGLDVLQHTIDYALQRTTALGRPLEIHAWVNMFNTWDLSTPPPGAGHIMNSHPEWVSETFGGVTLTHVQENALDPGIPAVQDHLYNVCLDLVRNYDIDGLHLDYIRLMQTDSGYDPVALQHFRDETGWDVHQDAGVGFAFRAWRREQISQLVGRIHRHTKAEKPWVTVSAFVVDFSDSVERLAQGYNQWAQRGWIDVIAPASYTNQWSTTQATYNRVLNYTRPAGGGAPWRPGWMALGAEDAWNNTPAQMNTFVENLRGQVHPPLGFVFFAHRGLTANNNQRLHGLSGVGGAFHQPALVASLPHDPPDTVPPLPVRQAAASNAIPGAVRITFQQPLPAADGDRPVQYRVYRATGPAAPTVHANLKMVMWDAEQGRTHFSWDDREIVPGQAYHYKIMAYDDWFNAAAPVVLGPVSNHQSGEGLSVTLDDTDATFSGVWVHSNAATSFGGGDRWAVSGGDPAVAQWRPTLLAAGAYRVDVWYRSSTNGAQDAPYTIRHAVGQATLHVDQRVNGGQWNALGVFSFEEGDASWVTLSDDAGPSVVYADAVRLVWQAAAPTPWEPKPLLRRQVATLLPGEAVIVDSEPYMLDWDADHGVWETSTFGDNHGDNTRFNRPPTSSPGCYVVNLPGAGRYVIDAYVRNSTFTERAFYRFADGAGVIHTVGPVSQKLRGQGFTVPVGDRDGYLFGQGPVYVSIYSDSTDGSEVLIADALRFTLQGENVSASVELY